MPPKVERLEQNLIDEYHPPIQVDNDLIESKVTKELLDEFLAACPAPRVVGVAPIYTLKGALSHIAVAVSTRVLVIKFHAKNKGASAYHGREILSAEILCNEDVTLVGFDLSKLAIALFTDQNLRILNGVDLQSACGSNREPLATIKFAAKDRADVFDENIKSVFSTIILQSNRVDNFALQAWVAQCIAGYEVMDERVKGAQRINTMGMEETELRIYATFQRGENRQQVLQPGVLTHEYSSVGARDRTAIVRSDRFQTRLQKQERSFTSQRSQQLVVHDPETGLDITLKGKVDAIIGRNATIMANASLEGRNIKSITTLGPDGPTNADRQRDLTVLQALQGQSKLLDNPFLQYIFHPSSDFSWPETFPTSDTTPPIVTQRPLNDSQQRAVESMLQHTDDTHLTIIQGPPGTGKTTVIAAFVCSAVSAGQAGIWLVAQSNIAVKNIAEKLADVGFQNWRLLVSADFKFAWHDHIYSPLIKNVIQSTEFKGARSRIQGVPVILCTLSMLAHPRIHTFTSANPITTLVIDEASQISLGSYVAPLQRFPSIHKICMIGDDKQLPPYGAEDDSNIKSIFEIEHLHSSIHFLSIQYRMPPLIGEVVSDVVYEGQLQSNPSHPVPLSQPCCWFVHVDDSREKQYETSWENPAERVVVLNIAAKLQEEGKEYCIITPYDAQRNLMEKDMKDGGLIWQDKCFNVDSFQGNEKDFIIVTLVRFKGLGFLNDLRRTNVMLSRCKRGMYIVTHWDFVNGLAANTLVGRMSAAWDESVWVNPEHLTVEA